VQDVRPSYLRIIFPKPGFFINDPRVLVTINGRPMVEQSFLQGFDWWTPMQPGFHYVEVGIVAIVTRSRTYNIEVRPSHSTEVLLEYSRMWGNFGSAPKAVYFRPC
jgi:hypothetical protein